MTSIRPVSALALPLEGTIELPGSKSHANRAIVTACLTEGETMIDFATPCDDVAVMVENIRAMGFRASWLDREKGTLSIRGGVQKNCSTKESPITLDCHNAGTTLRFLVSLASFVPGYWIVTGNEHMQKRPIADLVQALRTLGVEIEDTNGSPPVRIHGGTIRGNHVRLKADISSQYLTSLLLVAHALPQGLTIELDGPLTSASYVELTKRVLRDFGVVISTNDSTLAVSPQTSRSPGTYAIEADWSAAGAWLVLQELTRSTIHLPRLNGDSDQSDRLVPSILASLRGDGDRIVDVTATPDQLMNLAVFAAFRRGKTQFIGAKNLRFKECNRLAVTVEQLTKAGVHISEDDDGVTVSGPSYLLGERVRDVILDPHDDHRMAMCFAILGLLRGGVSILNPLCVGKSYEHFFDDLDRLVQSRRPLAIVGMRGAGKSNLARRVGSDLRLRVLDADQEFQKKHGDIRTFIAAQGWDVFRREEASIIEECLQEKDIVLACGGGAVETPAVRDMLKKRAVVLWVQATEEELCKRLSRGDRPRLTDQPLDKEVRTILEKRTPFFREVSHFILTANIPFSRQVPVVRGMLRRCLRSPRL